MYSFFLRDEESILECLIYYLDVIKEYKSSVVVLTLGFGGRNICIINI